MPLWSGEWWLKLIYSFLISSEDGGAASAWIVSACVFFPIALCRRLIAGLECQSFLASESQFQICQLVMWNQLLF